MQVHSVLESLQQGILICDQHSRIVFFNQVYSDFIGVPLETGNAGILCKCLSDLGRASDPRKHLNCDESRTV